MHLAFTRVARSTGCSSVPAVSPLLAAARLMLIGSAACGLASAQPVSLGAPPTSLSPGVPDARLVVTGARLPMTLELLAADVVVIDRADI